MKESNLDKHISSGCEDKLTGRLFVRRNKVPVKLVDLLRLAAESLQESGGDGFEKNEKEKVVVEVSFKRTWRKR